MRTFKSKSHRNDLEFDSTISVNRNIDDELMKLFKSDGYEIKIIEDRIKASQTDIDTVFQISEKKKL
ncbi:MAG: hypothetical protein L3J29_03540 [Cyclobacteriaceae bacterium]|nr:hypothetical protein [Cyclobacteriaceae bacterium]